MKRLRIWAVISCLAFTLAGQEPAANPGVKTREFLGLGPAPDAAAAKLGAPLYATNCAACHGNEGRGAQGPNLVRSPLVLHDEKGEEIGLVVRKGRIEGGMPALSGLSEAQIYDIAEFLHMQVELAANRGTYRDTYGNLRNQVSGDADQGKFFWRELREMSFRQRRFGGRWQALSAAFGDVVQDCVSLFRTSRSRLRLLRGMAHLQAYC